jgi:RNA polymerase sigma-70 factor (ECF subfamily)
MENHIRDILVGCLNNERRSQKDLHQLFYKFVFSICYRYESQLNVIEKLVNESFINVFKKIDEYYEGRYTDIYPSIQLWIKQIVVSACIENYHNKITNHAVHHVQAEIRNKRKLTNSNNAFSHKQIIEAIRELPPADRIIYNLFAIEEMPHEKTACLLKISVSDSRSKLESAREKLKKSLLRENSQYQNKTDDSYYSMITEEDCTAPCQ